MGIDSISEPNGNRFPFCGQYGIWFDIRFLTHRVFIYDQISVQVVIDDLYSGFLWVWAMRFWQLKPFDRVEPAQIAVMLIELK